METKGSIPFLDVMVTRNDDKLHTAVHRKETFTGQGIKYLSFIPENFKINAIKTLLYRCYTLSSNWLNFDKEINFLRTFFHSNGFPLSMFNNIVFEFLNGKFSPPTPATQTTTRKYVKLPFYGHLSYAIRKKLNIMLKAYYPDVKFIFIFTNNLTISSFFRFKDRVPLSLTPNVVYEFNCSSCKARYIGETKRNLTHRISEHKGVSVRTRKQLANPSFSAIRSHSHTSDHTFTKEDFNILHKANSQTDIKMLEAIYIKYLKPELNNQILSSQLYML